jgi:hypothetical protein
VAEAGLTLSYADLQTEVADLLGVATSEARVDRAIQAGYRKFLYPRLPDGQGVYQWGFLTPLTSITLYASIATTSGTTVSAVKDNGTSTVTASAAAFYPEMIGQSIVITSVGTFTITAYTSSTQITVSGDASAASASTFSIDPSGVFRMPDNFIDIQGKLTYEPDEGTVPMVKRSEEAIRTLRQTSDNTSGNPAYFALLRIGTHAGATGQRYDMIVWPDPDSNYVVKGRMKVGIDKLTTGNYPLGGPQHSETLKALCLGEAEKMFLNGPAYWAAEAPVLLAQSMADDASLRSDNLGYNGAGVATVFETDTQIVTVNGVDPST